jgi:hypothetical protein
MATWIRVARGTGTDLRAYLEAVTAAEAPRDAIHLRAQELVLRLAAQGGWGGTPEVRLDAGPGGSRSADLVLERGLEVVLVEVWDWLDDVGAAFRAWDRRLLRLDARATMRSREEGSPTTVTGLWILRATRRNRALVRDHRAVFAARFPVPGRAWLAALTIPGRACPPGAGLLWTDVRGTRLSAARSR